MKYLKQKMTESEKTYKDYKNLFNKLVQEAKNNFYIKKLSKCQGNTKRSWQIMKEITDEIKQKNNTLPKAVKINKKSLHTAEQIANLFTEYFNDAIGDSNLTTEEFETAFKSLKRNKVAGIDTISSNIALDT